uniref:Nucleolar 27S pre-rRNA processing Urb2/Npa2 C-terminal domain-containing protein n=2 Tax=Kalmanozyma brasiliensis (strain GHG001) TaxID=1365824 RepID=V5GGU5_KALBG
MRAAQETSSILSSLIADKPSDQGDPATRNIRAIIDQRYINLDTLGDIAQALDISLYHLREVRLLGEAGTDSSDTLALSKEIVETLCTVFGRAQALIDAEANERQKILRSAADVTLELLRSIDLHGRVSSGSQTALVICRTYAALVASLSGLREQRRLTEGLQRIVSRFTAEQYDEVLSNLLLILRGTASLVADAGVDNDQAALTTTLGLVLGSAPEGTSKVARSHLSSWLAILNTATAGPIKLRSIVSAVCALDDLCGNHAMLLRTQDMGALLQLFATLTGPSMADEPARALVHLERSELEVVRAKIFGGMVSTLGTLLRLRQDLMSGFLPQLSLLLARLVTLFRQLRNGGGASGSQRRTLRRDLPTWLDPVLVPPLGVGEARGLARLLSGLVVKSVPLAGGGKAESLAKPFGKHATGVLVAYLRCLTVQGAVVDAEVRKELEVGMMTVCEVMGVRQRDAAMVGLLDSAGKVLMKRVWGVFEKQRYKGQ